MGLLRATMIRAVKSDLLLLPKVRGGGRGGEGRVALLRATMIRAVKSDLAWLPPAGIRGTGGSAGCTLGRGGAAVAGRGCCPFPLLPVERRSPPPPGLQRQSWRGGRAALSCLPLTLRPAFACPCCCLPF